MRIQLELSSSLLSLSRSPTPHLVNHVVPRSPFGSSHPSRLLYQRQRRFLVVRARCYSGSQGRCRATRGKRRSGWSRLWSTWLVLRCLSRTLYRPVASAVVGTTSQNAGSGLVSVRGLRRDWMYRMSHRSKRLTHFILLYHRRDLPPPRSHLPPFTTVDSERKGDEPPLAH